MNGMQRKLGMSDSILTFLLGFMTRLGQSLLLLLAPLICFVLLFFFSYKFLQLQSYIAFCICLLHFEWCFGDSSMLYLLIIDSFVLLRNNPFMDITYLSTHLLKEI